MGAQGRSPAPPRPKRRQRRPPLIGGSKDWSVQPDHPRKDDPRRRREPPPRDGTSQDLRPDWTASSEQACPTRSERDSQADRRRDGDTAPNWSIEELGQGEKRTVEVKSWRIGEIQVTAEVADHEIYDGATPQWTYLRGTATGLPGGAAVSFIGSQVAPEPAGRPFLIGPRGRIDEVAARRSQRR